MQLFSAYDYGVATGGGKLRDGGKANDGHRSLAADTEIIFPPRRGGGRSTEVGVSGFGGGGGGARAFGRVGIRICWRCSRPWPRRKHRVHVVDVAAVHGVGGRGDRAVQRGTGAVRRRRALRARGRPIGQPTRQPAHQHGASSVGVARPKQRRTAGRGGASRFAGFQAATLLQ